MNDWQTNRDPENPKSILKPGGTIGKFILILSILPFVGFGVFMIVHVLKSTHGENYTAAIPFILFALVFCAVPIIQVITAIKRNRRNLSDVSASAANPAPPAKAAGKLGTALFGLPFAGFGVAALVSAMNKFSEGGFTRDAVMLSLFGLLFSSVGFGLMVFAGFSGLTSKKTATRQALFPGSPWLWREDWASGQIRPQRATAVMSWVFAAFWNGISWTVTAALFTDTTKARSIGVTLLVLIFPAIGLILLAVAIRSTLVARRFLGTVLRLKTLPAVPGGALEGMIELNTTLPKDAPVRTRLACLRRVTRRDSEGSHTEEQVVWQEERVLRPGLPEVRAGRTGIPLFFRIPDDQPATTPGDGSIFWRAGAEAKISGPDLVLQFEVPVFAGKAPTLPAEDPTAKYQLPIEAQRKALHSRIRVTNTPQGGREFYFPAARNIGPSLFFTLFAAIFATATWFLATSGAPFFFPIIFGLISVLMGMGCASMWLRRSRLVADASSLQSTQQWLFLTIRHEYRTSEIRELFSKVGMTNGQNAFHDLKARLVSGRSITLATGIGDKPEADWLLEELRRTLGLDRRADG